MTRIHNSNINENENSIHGKVCEFDYYSKDNLDLDILNKILKDIDSRPIEIREKLEYEYSIQSGITVNKTYVDPRDNTNCDNEFIHSWIVTVLFISNYLNVVCYKAECEIILYDKPKKLTNYEYFKMFNCEDRGIDIKYVSLFDSSRDMKKYTKNKNKLPNDIIDHIKSYKFGYENMSEFTDVLDNYKS